MSKILNAALSGLQTKGHGNIVKILANCPIREKVNSKAFLYVLFVTVDTDFTRSWFDRTVRKLLVSELESVLLAEGKKYEIEVLVKKGKETKVTNAVTKTSASKESGISGICKLAGIKFTPPKGFGQSNYMVSEVNKLVYDVTTGVLFSEGSSTKVVPLITLYGKSGVGKTHLLNALNEKLIACGKGESLLYCDIASFLSGFRRALSTRREAKFVEVCRQADFLLLDDLHYLTNNDSDEGHQAIVFDLLNNFVARTKPTIITCEDYPDSYRTIKSRITTRLKSGLVLEVKPPDYDLRYLILEVNAKSSGLSLSSTVLEFLADRIQKSPRDLIGSINTIKAHLGLLRDKEEIDIGFIERILANDLRHQQKAKSVDEILQIVSSFFGLTVSELTSKNKSRKVTYPRYVLMYLAREHTNASFPEIAGILSMHHTSVIHGCSSITKKMKDDAKLRKDLLALNVLISE